MAKPLFALTGTPKKGKQKKPIPKAPFIWTEECQAAFDTLRQRLMTPPILAYPDFREPFKLYTDASNLGLGAVLSQEKDGKERVIAYASRGLRKAERNDANYSAFKLELLALKWAVSEKFRDYLLGSEVDIYTDHNPLVHLDNASLGAVEQRWVAKLASFRFRIHYRAGRLNANADALSRLGPLSSDEGEYQVLEEEVVRAYFEPKQKDYDDDEEDGQVFGIEVDLLSGGSPILPSVTPDEIREKQESDLTIAKTMEFYQSGSKPTAVQRKEIGRQTRKLLGEWDRLSVKDGLLYRRRCNPRVGREESQLVLPSSLSDMVMDALHNKSGHFGVERTATLIQERFYWPYMHDTIARWCATCKECSLRHPKAGLKAPLTPMLATAPLEVVAMDYVTLERSADGYENVLVMTDLFTKVSVAVPTRNQTAVTTARALWKNFVLSYGFPRRIHTDQGANCESKLIRELCRLYGAEKSRTTQYHPAGNGQCERFNRTLIGLLRSLDGEKRSRWPDYIQALVYSYNNTTHSSTGYTPFYLMFGRHARLPLDVTLGLEREGEQFESVSEWVENHQEKFKVAYKLAQEQLQKAAESRQRQYNKKVKDMPLLPGERVLLRNRDPKRLKKIHNKWKSTPYTIVDVPHEGTPVYRVVGEDGVGPIKVVHRNELKPCEFRNTDREETPSRKLVPSEPSPTDRLSGGSAAPLPMIVVHPPIGEGTPCPLAEPLHPPLAQPTFLLSPGTPKTPPLTECSVEGVIPPLDQEAPQDVRRSGRSNRGVPPTRYEAPAFHIQADVDPIVLHQDWLRRGIDMVEVEDFLKHQVLERSVWTKSLNELQHRL